MKQLLIMSVLNIVLLISCSYDSQQLENATLNSEKITKVINKDYELFLPHEETVAVLILFGGYPENAKDIEKEFQILEMARKNKIAVLLSNFNQKLWLGESEKIELANILESAMVENKLPMDEIYIGGFSSGGVVAALIGNYMAGKVDFSMSPKGIFIIDAPIDLEALYKSSEKNVERNYSEPSFQESLWLMETLKGNFGDPMQNLEKYEDNSVFTYSTSNISNLKDLKDIKIRLYTEPDTLWWKENRNADFDQMNAFYIKALHEKLVQNNYKNVEYITTSNKGYRANGERHPHSWSIVDKQELINWMLER